MPCNSSTCIDRSGNLGLLLFCTLVHAIKGDVFKKKKKGWEGGREGRGEGEGSGNSSTVTAGGTT